MDSRRVVLTGATGFLGRHLLAELTSRGIPTRAVARRENHPRLGVELPAGTEVIWADLNDVPSLTAAFTPESGETIDVIHCAGHISIRSRLSPELNGTNVDGTANVIEAARAAGVHRLLYVSSTHARKEDPHGTVMAETTEFDPDLVEGGYNKSKAAASRSVLQATDLSPVVVQPSGMVGPGEYGNGFLIDVIRQAAYGRRSAIVEGAYDIVDVRDVARSTVEALDVAPSGGVYLLTGELVDLRTIVQTAAQAAGRQDYRPVALPGNLLRRIGPLIEWVADRRGAEPLMTSFSIDTLTANATFDNSRARRELGHDPRPAQDTIRDTVAYWRDRS